MKIVSIVMALLLVLLMFPAANPTPTQAQTGRDIWYWAWRPYDLEVEHVEDQRSDVLAFTPDGTVNVLLEDVFPVVLDRLDDRSVTVAARSGDAYSMYFLTPTEAHPMLELFDQAYIEENRLNAIYDGYTYYLPEVTAAGEHGLLLADRRQGIYAIYDVIQDTTTFYDMRAWCWQGCVRVSTDGRYIRYRVSPIDPARSELFYDPGERALPYQIYEFDTVSKVERLVYEQTEIAVEEDRSQPRAHCTPDQFGNRWYCELFLDDDQNWIYTADKKIIVHIDGTIEPVNDDWQLRVWDDRWYFLDLDAMPFGCADCTITVYPDGRTEASFEFYVPPYDEGSVTSEGARMLSEEHLLLNPTGLSVFALSRSGELTELGSRACCADPFGFDFYDEEAGLMVAINISNPDETRTVIWNTRLLEQIASLPGYREPGVRSTFRNYSLVMYGDPIVAYSYLDEVLYMVDLDQYRAYLDAFPGGVLLAGDDGIHRWTPDEGGILLIERAVPIPRHW